MQFKEFLLRYAESDKTKPRVAQTKRVQNRDRFYLNKLFIHSQYQIDITSNVYSTTENLRRIFRD